MTIQEQMKTRDITYAEIAKHLNVSRQYLSAMMTNISEKSSHYEAIVDYVLSHNNSPFLIGDMIANKKGSVGLVLNIDHKTITIQFQDEFKYTDEFNVNNIVRGVFVNPYHKSVYGVGYMGVGRFSSMSHPRIRNCWQTMLQRCYANNLSDKYASVGKVEVCSRWHNFQNFAEDITIMDNYNPNGFWKLKRTGSTYDKYNVILRKK